MTKTTISTVDSFIAHAMNLPLPANPQDLPPGAICARSGEPIIQGYRIKDVVAKTTPVVQDIFRIRSEYLSIDSGRMFASGRLGPFGHFIAIRHGEDFEFHRPMISRDSATAQGRHCWSSYVRQLPEGIESVTVFGDDVKKRLWPDARISIVGPFWQPYLYDGSLTSRVLRINYAEFLRILDLVEDVYTLGFSKSAIQEGLISTTSRKVIQFVGWDRTSELESMLAIHRATDALLLATYIAQKTAPIENTLC